MFAAIMAVFRVLWRTAEGRCQNSCGKCLCTIHIWWLYYIRRICLGKRNLPKPKLKSEEDYLVQKEDTDTFAQILGELQVREER